MVENNPALRGVAWLIIVGGFLITVAVIATLTTPIRPLLPVWSVVVANALAALLAGAYLLGRRPGLWRRLLPRAAV